MKTIDIYIQETQQTSGTEKGILPHNANKFRMDWLYNHKSCQDKEITPKIIFKTNS